MLANVEARAEQFGRQQLDALSDDPLLYFIKVARELGTIIFASGPAWAWPPTS